MYITELYQWLRVYVLSDGMSHIVLGSRGCNIVVLNAHATTDSKSDDLREGSMSNYCIYSVTLLRHMKIMLGDFNAELGREIIFKPTTGNEIW